MIFEAEECDIKEVKRVAFDCIAILLTDEQAFDLIKNNKKLAKELFMCNSYLDTTGRQAVFDALVERVMQWPQTTQDKPKLSLPKNKPLIGLSWSWPCYGDSVEYKKEFYAEFKRLATSLDLKLDENWEKEMY